MDPIATMQAWLEKYDLITYIPGSASGCLIHGVLAHKEQSVIQPE